jgi:flagellar motor switch protein FliN
MPVLHAQPEAPVAQPSPEELQRVLHLEVPLVVTLAQRKLNVSEILRLGVGSIIEFVRGSDEPLQLLANNKVIGVGEAVKVGENFGLRITQIGDAKQIVNALGGQQ